MIDNRDPSSPDDIPEEVEEKLLVWVKVCKNIGQNLYELKLMHMRGDNVIENLNDVLDWARQFILGSHEHGVSLWDLAMIMAEGDPDHAREIKDSVDNSRRWRKLCPKPIGIDSTDPKHRTFLFQIPALCVAAEIFFSYLPCSQVQMKKRLAKVARVAIPSCNCPEK